MSKDTKKIYYSDIIERLNSMKPEKQKEGVKLLTQEMTTGKDVSKLLPHVIKCMATNDLELKKLVYLYIINYARIRPLEAILAVNYFKKDSSDLNSNPLTRALAVRTMGCLGVDQIMQFLCDPLRDALKDRDPYVRKTAVLCVAKMFDVNQQLVEEQFCFIDVLQSFLEEEGNAMVLGNCVASLIEISQSKGVDVLKINWKRCKHLLNALHDNNEWIQIYLLEGISRYAPKTQEETAEVIERVMPFISHSNPGVVLTAVKILVKLLDLVDNIETVRNVCKKVTPSLVTLLNSEPEIQYVALKNIGVLIQKRPIIFEKDISRFFCSFTEPIYNKMEKLEIIYKLVSMNNIDSVLNELKDYASEVDVQFVKRAVRLIGQCAIKLEKAAQRCVELLVDLVKTQISFVIQEAIIALRDIFRRYPNNYEGAMAMVNENLRTLNDAEAKAALIWIIGEYSDRIDGAENQLLRFLDNLKEEPFNVQLQILNSSVKTFLKLGTDESFNILNSVFDFCFKECDNPDLRERGYVYWRLMNIDPNLATHIVLSEKAVISQESSNLDPSLLDKLMDNLGTLAIIYSKPPELFVKKTKRVNIGEEEEYDLEDNNLIDENENEVPKSNNKNSNYNNNRDLNESDIVNDKTLISDFSTKNQLGVSNAGNNVVTQVNSGVNLIDLNDLLGGGPQVPTQSATQNSYNNLVNQNNVLTGMNFNSTSSLNYNPNNNANPNVNANLNDAFGAGYNANANANANNVSLYNTINLGNDSIISMSPSNPLENSNFYSISPNNNFNNNVNVNANPNSFGDLLGTSVLVDPAQKVAVIPKMNVISENMPGFNNKTLGFSLDAALQHGIDGLHLHLVFSNRSNIMLSDFEIEFNKNYFGLKTNCQNLRGFSLAPGQTMENRIEIIPNVAPESSKVPGSDPPYIIECAMKTNTDFYYFNIPIMMFVLFLNQNNRISLEEYQRQWMGLQTTQDMMMTLDSINAKYQNVDGLIKRLETNNIFSIFRKDVDQTLTQLSFYGIFPNGQLGLIGIPFNTTNPSQINVICKSESSFLIRHLLFSLKMLLVNDI